MKNPSNNQASQAGSDLQSGCWCPIYGVAVAPKGHFFANQTVHLRGDRYAGKSDTVIRTVNEVIRRAGNSARNIRLFGLPQNRLGGLFILVILCTTAQVMSCPMCKDSAVDSPTSATVDRSSNLEFNKSIYIMLGGFFTVVGFTGRVMYRAVKSASPHA